MRIKANEIFTFKGTKYKAVREYGQIHKYKVMKYNDSFWTLAFKADTLSEVLEIVELLENGKDLENEEL